jgi:hypothetical protein
VQFGLRLGLAGVPGPFRRGAGARWRSFGLLLYEPAMTVQYRFLRYFGVHGGLGLPPAVGAHRPGRAAHGAGLHARPQGVFRRPVARASAIAAGLPLGRPCPSRSMCDRSSAPPPTRTWSRSLRPRRFEEFAGQAPVTDNLRVFVQAAKLRERGAGPRAAARPTGPGEDHLGGHHRAGNGGGHAHHQRPRAGQARRPGGPAHQPGAQRPALHRRDPPPEPRGGGIPVQRHGGLPDRPGDRCRPQRAHGADQPQSVHAGGRHHPQRPAHGTVAGALRHQQPPGLLRHGPSSRAS